MATSVQFSIRSLMIAMVLAAVGLAAAMPVIRSWGTAVQMHFMVNAAVLAGLVGIFSVGRCVMRRNVERQAGEIVLRAPTQGNHFARLLYLCLLLVFIVILFGVAATDARPRPAAFATRPWFVLAYLGWAAAWLITNCWWGTGPGIVELAEHGLIERGTRFTPYARFRTFRWSRYFRDILVLSSRDYSRTQIIVPRWEREHVDEFLRNKGLISPERACSTQERPSGEIES